MRSPRARADVPGSLPRPIAALLHDYAASQRSLDAGRLMSLHVDGPALVHVWFPGRIDEGGARWRRRITVELSRMSRLTFRFGSMRHRRVGKGLALAFGRWSCRYRRRDGAAGRGSGLVTLLLRRVGGEWRIAADHFSARWGQDRETRGAGVGEKKRRGAEAGTRTPKP